MSRNTIAMGLSLTQSESVSDSLTRGRAHARTREDGITEICQDSSTRAVAMRDLADYYQSSFGAYCPQCARRDMAAALDAGLDYALLIVAIDEAAVAPRPSWAYARAILRRCINQGIHTEEDYSRGQAAWRLAGGRRGHDLPF